MFLNIHKLVNWRDICYILVIQFTIKFGYINIFGYENRLTNNLFFLLILSLLCIVISGFLTNNYLNSKTHKKDPKTLFYTVVLSLLGIALGCYVSFKVNKEHYSVIFFLFNIVVYLASKNLRNRSFLRSLTISLLISFSVLAIWWFSEPIQLETAQWDAFLKLELIIILIAVLVFIGNLVRTILVDLAYREQDQESDLETIVSVFGITKSKGIIFALSVMVIILISVTFLFYIKCKVSFTAPFMASILTVSFLFLTLRKAKSSQDYLKIVRVIDFVLFFGLIIIPITAILLKNAIQ